MYVLRRQQELVLEEEPGAQETDALKGQAAAYLDCYRILEKEELAAELFREHVCKEVVDKVRRSGSTLHPQHSTTGGGLHCGGSRRCFGSQYILGLNLCIIFLSLLLCLFRKGTCTWVLLASFFGKPASRLQICSEGPQ